MKITINNKEIECSADMTILQAASANGIDIPTLCHDERVAVYGACGICTVEVEGNPRLIRACSTMVSDGMVITTESERISNNRKLVLELLLSDHTGDCKAPCTLSCPANTDCQGYVKAVAEGDYAKAAETVNAKIPFPSSIGRVCPRPCETACRRQLVEEPISICGIKQFIGDNTEAAKVKTAPDTDKKIAVIGGGPGGLSAAYYLRLKGHDITVFEAQPKLGGMLQYGIPEYRLPKEILQNEISRVSDTGVKFKLNTKVKLDDLTSQGYDAVIVAIGAWTGTGLRCKGEEADGVIGGIDYLYEPTSLAGKNVAIVGGGNTAMDACRTAVRMGAEKVYCIYRRTRAEMPAEDIEISEAIEEGVIFKFLTNPIEILNDNGKVNKVNLQIMELGEPDASGRRSPIAVEGKTELLDVDVVISAIGQKPNLDGFEQLEQTKWGTVAANATTFEVKLADGKNSPVRVFAIGDATNNGADIAVAAIGEGGRCANVVDAILTNGDFADITEIIVKDEKTAEDFADKERYGRAKRANVKHRPPLERAKDFKEVYTLFGEAEAKKEAERCLECGCSAYRDNSCKLIRYANRYSSDIEHYKGDANRYDISPLDHEKILRNPEKCVLCGLCVRVCAEVEDKTALGLYGRGFSTVVKPALGKYLKDTDCNSCGKCAETCPTGAITFID